MPKKTFEILSSFDEVEKLNYNLKIFYKKCNIHIKDIIEIEIIQIEALNNIVKHSYSGNTGKKIKVVVEVGLKVWKMKLTDYGIPRNNLKIPKLDFNPADIESLPENGMGLFLINKLTEYHKYVKHSDRNEFYMQKDLLNETLD